MTWDSTWEEIFKKQEWGKYPPEQLVRFIARNYYNVPDRKNIKILDIGCGTGAATWYLAREGFSAYGIDGSTTAIKIAKHRFEVEELNGYFEVGDFTKLNYPDNFFDCVVDIVALQHNQIKDVKIILNEIKRVLKPNGKIFSIMANTKTIIDEPYQRGYTHYFSRREVRKLFLEYKNLRVEKNERTDNKDLISHYIVCAEK